MESTEETLSRTLGSADTFSDLNENEGETSSPKNQGTSKQKNLWADLFKQNKDTLGASAALKFYPPVNGNAQLELNEILTIKEQWGFGLLGSFAGRFPGIKAIQTLVESWKTQCKFFSRPNGHVLFRFQSEEDRCAIIENGPYFLFGKRLFLKSLPEKFRLENEDFSIIPIWVRLPFLPLECWHPAALGKISSCIGTPICSDQRTREFRKGSGEFARVLVDVDTSQRVTDSVLVNMPNGDSFRQKVTYEINPCYCTKCKSNEHLKDECTGNRPWTKRKGKKARVSRNTREAATAAGQAATTSEPSLTAEQGPCAIDAVLPNHSALPEPCPEASASPDPGLDLPDQTTQLEPCLESTDAPLPSKDVPTVPSLDGAGEDLNVASSDGSAEPTREDNQPASDHAEPEISSPEEETEIVRDKQPAAPVISSSTVGMGTRSKAKAVQKGFKDALLSPPKEACSGDNGATRGNRAGNRFVPLPVGGKTVARGGGRRQPTSGVK